MNIRATSSFRPGNLAAVQEAITARVLRATTKTTQAVLDDALEKVPVDIGDLQSSGHMVVTLEGQTVHGSVIFDADHAAYVEFGTGIRGAASPGAGPYPYKADWPGMPAQPYARPALDENEGTFKDNLRAEGFKV